MLIAFYSAIHLYVSDNTALVWLGNIFSPLLSVIKDQASTVMLTDNPKCFV